ncbi:MAG: alpha-galactosidase [Limisphaerales bacterium]
MKPISLPGSWLLAMVLSGVSFAPPSGWGSETIPLASLDLTKATQGWGVSQANKSITGKTLAIAGRQFERGFGTHAEGKLAVIVGGKAERFSAWVGIDDGAGKGRGSVRFKVSADGKELWNSGVMRGGDRARRVEVDLRGAWLLTLVSATAGDGYEYGHADWAEAQILMTSGRPITVAPGHADLVVESLRKPARVWTLRSGQVEYRLRHTAMGLDCLYFGPAGGAPTEAPFELRPDFHFRVEGRDLGLEDLLMVDATTAKNSSGGDSLQLVLRHRVLPLEIQTRYDAWGQCGVITRRLTLVNRGANPLHVASAPSLSWRLPAGEYELTTLQGSWGAERQVVTEPLAGLAKTFESAHGRSTAAQSPWFSLRHSTSGLRYLAQLAWSGNWDLRLERANTNDIPMREELLVTLGARFDYGGAALLPAGDSLELPGVAFTCTRGDLDDAANALHRYQRQFVVPQNPANEPPLVQFNSWYPFPGKMNLADMKRCVDVAADIGAEVFVLDAGWYNKTDWFREAGDWHPDLKAFPNGTAELAQYAHRQGMKFGIWVEMEVLGDKSEAFKAHHDWCLKRDGQPFVTGGHYHLDFGKPEVRAWARAQMECLIQENQLDWVKIDYNNSIGEDLELDDGTRPGTVLYHHLRGYYAWLDELRAAHPRLVIENCSSGGLRFDLGILAHTHTTWLSDRVAPLPSVQLAYGATLEFTPQVCNHWMVGDAEDGTVILTNAPGWWDFMFRVPMNGQYGISSRVFGWNAGLRQRAKDNVSLYKRLRSVIAGGDCYHLTPPPSHEKPAGWMALQYVTVDRQNSVLMVYRLGRSEPQQKFGLRGLDAAQSYRLSQDGVPKGTFKGGQLAQEGFSVNLPEEWRAAVLELEATHNASSP